MLAPPITRGWSSSSLTASAVSSLTVDITGATASEWVYCFLTLRQNETTTAMTGWTQVAQIFNGTAVVTHAIYRRRKVAGDTTFSITWTTVASQGDALLQQWLGLDANTPDEVVTSLAYTAAGGTFTTSSATPNGVDRWAVAFYSVISGQSTNKTAVWSLSGDATNNDITGVNTNGTTLWANNAIADSNGVVTAASHSATATTTNFAFNGGASTILFLVPAETVFPGVQTLQAVNRAGVF